MSTATARSPCQTFGKWCRTQKTPRRTWITSQALSMLSKSHDRFATSDNCNCARRTRHVHMTSVSSTHDACAVSSELGSATSQGALLYRQLQAWSTFALARCAGSKLALALHSCQFPLATSDKRTPHATPTQDTMALVPARSRKHACNLTNKEPRTNSKKRSREAKKRSGEARLELPLGNSGPLH